MIIEFQAWVVDPKQSVPGKRDLRPVGISVSPEDRAPSLVQCVKRLVFFPAPVLKGHEAVVVIAIRIAEFVVNLKADDIGIIFVMLSEKTPGQGARQWSCPPSSLSDGSRSTRRVR